MSCKYAVLAFVGAVFALAPLSVSAWEGEVETEYTMGDGDSRITARESAYQALKIEAARKAGTYIQGTTRLTDDGLEETIEVLGASLVTLHDVDSSFTLDDEARGVLRKTARAEVDEQLLRQRVAKMQEDRQLREDMEALVERNKELQQRLEAIRQTPAQQRALNLPDQLDQQAETYREIHEITQQADEIFERGNLVDLADDFDDDLDRAKDAIREGFLAELQNTPIRTVVRDVRRDNGEYRATVAIWWEPDLDKAETVLRENMDVTGNDDYRLRNDYSGFAVEHRRNQSEARNATPHSEALMEWLGQKELVAKITIAGETKTIPLMYQSRSRLLAVNEACTLSAYIGEQAKEGLAWEQCVNSLNPGSSRGQSIFGVNLANPIQITLTERQAESASRVVTDVVLRSTQDWGDYTEGGK